MPANSSDGPEENLNFAKSKLGLADLYAQDYEEEVFGQASKQDEKLSKEKLLCKELFGKLMYKLDQLTNSAFTAAPIKHRVAEKNVASIMLEEAVPTTFAGISVTGSNMKLESTLSSSYDKQSKGALKSLSELDREELKALRSRKKDARRKSVIGRVKEGEITEADAKKRKEDLGSKNAEVKKQAKEKEDRLKKGKREGTEVGRRGGLSNNEVLARASELLKESERKDGDLKQTRKSKESKSKSKEGATSLKEWKKRNTDAGSVKKTKGKF